jgi:hypothetical protein
LIVAGGEYVVEQIGRGKSEVAAKVTKHMLSCHADRGCHVVPPRRVGPDSAVAGVTE